MGTARQWLRFAKEDLAAARAFLERADIAPRVPCFLAQQAAEKAIKSRLIQRAVPFPRVHDLEQLWHLLPDDLQQRIDFDPLAELSTWVIEGRYPGDLPEASPAQAKQAVAAAARIVTLSRRRGPGPTAAT